MTAWTALGGDPTPGDVGTVRRTATELGSAGDHVELLVGTLRRVDAGTGPAVWRGPAADGFRGSLAAAGPRLTALANAYQSARTATAGYATSLALAQEKARRAEHDGEQAQEDHRLAKRAYDRAAVDTSSWMSALRAAELGLADAATRLLTPAAMADPGYHAQLVTWQQQIADQRAHADTRRAESLGRQQAAQQAMQAADHRLALARGVAAEAADEIFRAAQELARKLGAPVRRPVVPRGPRWTVDDPKIVVASDGSVKLNLGGSQESAIAEKGFAVDGGGAHFDGNAQFGVVEKSVDGSFGRNDDGSYGAALGLGGGLYLARGSLNERIGSEDFGVEQSVSGSIGAHGHAGTEIGFGKDGIGAKAGADVFAGAEVAGSVGANIGGVRPTLGAKGRAGIGASADAEMGYHDGTIKVTAKLGATLGFGGEIDPSIEINVPQVAKNVTNGAKTVEKSLKSVFDW